MQNNDFIRSAVAVPVGHNEPLLIAMKLHGLARTRPLAQHRVRLSFMAR